MDNLLKDMGKRIFDRRKQLNMTQETLAELAHVTPQTPQASATRTTSWHRKSNSVHWKPTAPDLCAW